MTARTKMTQKQRTQTPLEQSSFLQHCLRYQNWYLLSLLILLAGSLFFQNYVLQKPLLSGEENYYHLAAARDMTWKTAYYFPLAIIEETQNGYLLASIPFLMAIATFLLAGNILPRLGFGPLQTFLFLFLLIFTPTFLKGATTLSSPLFFLFLLTLSFFFLLHHRRVVRYCAIFSSMIIAFIDQWSVLLTVVLFTIYTFRTQKREPQERRLIASCVLVLISTSAMTAVISDTPFILGPFHTPLLARDIISDFGGFSGISFFVFALGILGFILTWPQKTTYAGAYILLPLLIPAYLYNTETMFHFSIVFIFFATQAILYLNQRQWQLPTLQQFTLFLLFLGIFFSSLTYISRGGMDGPTADDVAVLTWMRDYLPKDALITSFPDDAETIRYFAQRNPFFANRDQDTEKENENDLILSAVYVHQLFPLLEKNGIGYVYISHAAAERLPRDQGLFFLFQNERFKMLHSAGKSEVWRFNTTQ
ncbi:hypothetical protein HY496_00320 [Candidatus Woesearchaeota archaeon]|nr:hypothetical protein [Candidatus Woesearchaeota archaeon]